MMPQTPIHDTAPLFAELILPIPIPHPFTYLVPAELKENIKVGQRAIVPLGTRKILTGIVCRLHQNALSTSYKTKNILDLLDTDEAIRFHQFDLYQWIADYYMCTPGEVMQAALPSGLLLSSKSMAQVHPSFDGDLSNLSQEENIVLQRLARDTAGYSDLAKLLNKKNIYPILKSLSAKKAIILFEQLREKYKPKKEKRIRLAHPFTNSDQLQTLFEKLKRRPRQEYVLLCYLRLVPALSRPNSNAEGIEKSSLLENGKGLSSLKTLVKEGVFEEFEVIVPRYKAYPSKTTSPPSPCQLNEQQQTALNRIQHFFETKNTVLLHGITGSGKTEIYVKLIKKVLNEGRQVLLLIPEIALTAQIVNRLKKAVGAEPGVYHSKFSDNERVEIWNGVLQRKLPFVIGVRSSVFLPFDNLGLIIVDEEHDSSYKQSDTNPRYNARDVALVMGVHHRAKVVLGSATPSAESYFHALQKKYGLVSLTDRFGDAPLPEVVLVDMLKEKKYTPNRDKFSAQLINAIDRAVKNDEQVLLFLNRRGYAPIVQCEHCGWTPQCTNCAVSLTYHQTGNQITCHYCGYRQAFPRQCPECGSKRLLTKGYGTERVAEELKLRFENVNVQRMDRDTTRTRAGYESIIMDFEQSKTQILVGTQMITKGLDFSNVAIVGIFDADRMRYFPDFRSHERTFQLITQAGGRAGRRDKKGQVIVQTTNPKHELFDYINRNDVTGFLTDQLHDRHAHSYPPYVRLVEITVKHTYAPRCDKLAKELSQSLKIIDHAMKIVGPGEPVVSKIKNEFLRTILVKLPRGRGNLKDIKKHLQHVSDELLATKEYRASKIVFNVDPM